MKKYKIPLWAKILGAAVLAAVGYKIWRTGWSFGKSIKADIRSDQQIAQINNNASQLGIDPARSILLVEVSGKIYKAFYDNDWFGWSEDEDAATSAFNTCQSIQEAKLVAHVYRQSYSKSLYSDFDAYVNSWNQSPTKHLIEAIKGI